MATTFDGWTLNGIKNPNLLQSLILDKFKDSTDGAYEIVDGNNVASFLIEGFSTIASKAIQKIDDSILPAIYASRAQSVTDLYKHMSDYDYLGLFSEPSSCSILLIVDKDYLMTNAVSILDDDGNELYRKVIIPKSTRFTIGQYSFGLYYPIEIRVSSSTGMFTVLYDSTETNPLHILSENILEYSFRKRDTMNLAYIKIPVYQFNTTNYEEPLINGSGYRRVLDYSDKFYAIRCVADVYDKETETWSNKELELALSGRQYDPETPTVVFSVDPKNNQCVVEVPYVYFTNELIRGNLKIEIYTTCGYLNYQIPTDTEELVSIDMFGIPLDKTTQVYAEPFRTMPALAALPITTQIIGGTNGMSYKDLRRKVVNDAFGDATLQTPADVDAYFSNLGYVTSLMKDGITDRIFNAHVVLRNTDDAIIAAASVNTQITLANLDQTNSRSIINCGNNVYTILPSTRYKFDESKGICIPLTDEELDTLNSLTASEKVAAFNKNIYTLSPFHLQISVKDRYPTTATYDMTDAEVESREFLTARDTSQHLSLNTLLMEVVPIETSDTNDRITDKYKFTFRILRSGLDNVEAIVNPANGTTGGHENIRVVVGLKKLDNSYAFATAEYKGLVDDFDLFEMEVESTAVFTETESGHTVRIKSPFSESGVDSYLSTEMRVILCLNGTVDDLGARYATTEHPNKYLITDYTKMEEDADTFIALSEHRVNLRFGTLINEVDQRISLTYSGDDYVTYNTTELAVTEVPIYATDVNGVPTYTLNADSTVTLKTLYPTGTIKSYTNLMEESVVMSRFLATNYAGCDWIDPDNAGTAESPIWQTSTMGKQLPSLPSGDGYWDLTSTGTWTGKDVIKRLEGRDVTIMGHIAPRFSITQARVMMDGEAPIVGTYELANAGNPKRGAFSTSSDEWYYSFSNTVNGIRTTHTYQIKAVDALRFVMDNVLTKKDSIHVVDGAQTYALDGLPETWYKNPISELVHNYANGMFVLVENDGSDYVAPVNLQDASNEKPAKLYFRQNDAWVCVLACDDYDSLKSYVTLMTDGYMHETEIVENTFLSGKDYYRKQSDGSMVKFSPTVGATIDKANTYVRRPSNFGYALVISRVEKATYNAGERTFTTKWSASETECQYVAFLNMLDNGAPNFAETKMVLENADTGAVIQSLDADVVWKNRVNIWPWEVTKWHRLNASAVTGARIYEEDTQLISVFDVARMSKYCIHTSGQVVLDAYGKPTVKPGSKREVQYLINMIQVDAKLAETTAVKTSHTYPSEIVSTMRTHFNNLGAVKNRLYTNTKLYFEPMKSLGFASFYTDGESTKEYPLDIRMGFRLHVSSDIAEDTDMMDAMKESIVKLIDDHMADGSTNLAEIARLIMVNNSDSVKYVDVLGISDGSDASDSTVLNPDLQTMRCVENEVRPHLKHELKLLDDGVTIDLTRGLDLEFVTADV